MQGAPSESVMSVLQHLSSTWQGELRKLLHMQLLCHTAAAAACRYMHTAIGISDLWGLLLTCTERSVVTHVAEQDTKHSAGSLGAKAHSAAVLASVLLPPPVFAAPYS